MIDDHQELLGNIIMRTLSKEHIVYIYIYIDILIYSNVLQIHFFMMVLVMMLAGYLRDPTMAGAVDWGRSTLDSGAAAHSGALSCWFQPHQFRFFSKKTSTKKVVKLATSMQQYATNFFFEKDMQPLICVFLWFPPGGVWIPCFSCAFRRLL